MPAAKKPQAAKPKAAGLCGALIKLRPKSIDLPAIRKVVGTGKVKTLNDVAHEFGQSPNTIKQSWRGDGMPGGPGGYPLAEIVAWRLQHLDDLDERTSGPTPKSQSIEIKDLEIRERLLDVKAKERRDALADGNMVDAHRCRSELSALIVVLRQRLGRVGANVEPMLPAEIAVDTRVEIDREVSRQMKWFAETSPRILENEAHAAEAAE
jgi:hypothetical protein